MQRATGENVALAYVDQGYTGVQPETGVATHGIRSKAVKLSEARHGFVLLPQRWVVERTFAFASRFRRLARDYERLPDLLSGLHFLAFACLLMHQFTVLTLSP